MKIETLDKDPQIIAILRNRYSKWRDLLDTLPVDKMLAISEGKLGNIRNNIIGSFRNSRKQKRNLSYTIHTAIRDNILYVWKILDGDKT